MILEHQGSYETQAIATIAPLPGSAVNFHAEVSRIDG